MSYGPSCMAPTAGLPITGACEFGRLKYRQSAENVLATDRMDGRNRMLDWSPKPYKNYRWIVADPELLGGKLAVRGTRLSVSLILECLSNGMTLIDIDGAFSNAFPHEALPEVLKVASEFADTFHVAA